VSRRRASRRPCSRQWSSAQALPHAQRAHISSGRRLQRSPSTACRGVFSTPAEGVAPAASELAASEYAQDFITGANPAGAVPGKRAVYLRAVVVVWPSNTDGSIVVHASGIAVDVPAWGYQPSGRANRPNGPDAC